MKKNYTIVPLFYARKWRTLSLIILSLLTYNYHLLANNTIIADAPCNPRSTLPCDQLGVTLPFSLTFNSSVANSIIDKSGIGTGFTMVDTYSGPRASADGSPTNANVPGYEASKLTVSSGILKILTSKGIASTTSNNQLNSLGVRVDSRSKLQLDVTLINPYNGSQFEQGGLWFGLNDKTFVKLVVTGNKVEMRKELNDVSNSADQRITASINGLNNLMVRLRLVINPINNTVEGFYSTDGTTFLNVGATYSTKSLEISNMGLTNSTAYAGIFASHRNAAAAVTYTFDNFGVQSLTTPNPLNSNAYLVLENPDKLPAADQLTFSNIQKPWRRRLTDSTFTRYNENHNRIKLKISNKGSGDLIITNLALSNPGAWKIDTLNGVAYNPAAVLPLKLISGASAEVGIQFIAKDLGTTVVILNDQLVISSNDDIAPNKEVTLRGLWQAKGEGVNEPNSQQIINAFGYKSNTGYGKNDDVVKGKYIVPNSDEIAADYFVQVDPSVPITVTQLAAYHGCCNQAEKIQWYDKQTGNISTLFYQEALDGQSLLPRRAKYTTGATKSFNTAVAFGFIVGTSYSDRTKNYNKKIGMRFWKAIDNKGNIIPNTYIFGTDYLGTDFTNYDYQDNVYFVSNVRPENIPASIPALASTPSNLSFGALQAGANKSLSVQLTNQVTESVQISAVEVVGPNLGEFTATMPSTTALAANTSTTVNVQFKPVSRGLKNAALLVHHNGLGSPHRIPLYGLANDASFTLGIVKRIKGAADANVTINEITWEADKAYRQGSIKLDKQVVAGPIAATDEDLLYQSYLSAASNLAETRYEVPLANGTYWVRMHFVENFFNGPAGSRVFNTSIENELRQSGFDIYREVGYRAALVKDFEVIVKDGGLSVKFNPTANRVAIAAMEIYKANSATVTSVSNETITGINADAVAELVVFPNPNPVNSQVKVALTGFTPNQKVSLEVQDAMGRQIHSQQVITDSSGAVQSDLPTTLRLSAGLYLINAQGINTKAQAKLLVK